AVLRAGSCIGATGADGAGAWRLGHVDASHADAAAGRLHWRYAGGNRTGRGGPGLAVLPGILVMIEMYQQSIELNQTGSAVHVWRHPRAMQVAGRCIGHVDVVVMPRKARRLAHRIRQFARVNRLPACIWTSDLQRSLCVGRVLAGWGWTHRVDADLREVDF